MIRTIKGAFHPNIDGSVIIETTSGIGFRVFVPGNSSIYRNVEGDQVKLYTSMIVREDDISLYGFSDKESLELFELLITVNGIGAKAGMSIMSILSPWDLKNAIASGDSKAICAANGVGKKTAERVILELKDKVESFGAINHDTAETVYITNDNRTEAINALISLGYTKNEATSAVGRVAENDLSCEDYIKRALRDLF